MFNKYTNADLNMRSGNPGKNLPIRSLFAYIGIPKKRDIIENNDAVLQLVMAPISKAEKSTEHVNWIQSSLTNKLNKQIAGMAKRKYI